MQVRPGDRVTIHGLTGKPELNGQSGILVGPAANGRVTIKLDSGQDVALKQQNLGVQAPGGASGGAPPPGAGGFGGGGMPGFGGGMPGFGGGMPGFGGGVPGFGGMPGMPPGGPAAILGQIMAKFEQQLHAMGLKLPPGVSPEKAAAGLAIAVVVVLYLLKRYVSFYVMVPVGLIAYMGTQTDKGRATLAQLSAQISMRLGRHIQPNLLLVGLCVLATVCGQYYLGGGGIIASTTGSGSTPATDHYGAALREAYKQGYDDALAGLDPRPPKHIPSADHGTDSGKHTQTSSSGGFGLGSIFRYIMVGSYFHRLGQTPGGWSLPTAIANLQAQPLQAVMMLAMVSGMIF